MQCISIVSCTVVVILWDIKVQLLNRVHRCRTVHDVFKCAVTDRGPRQCAVFCSVRRWVKTQVFCHENPSSSYCSTLIASQEISATSRRHLCDMQFNDVAVALSQFSKIVPIKMAYLRYAVCGCCLCMKNANCYKKLNCYKFSCLLPTDISCCGVKYISVFSGVSLRSPRKTRNPHHFQGSRCISSGYNIFSQFQIIL